MTWYSFASQNLFEVTKYLISTKKIVVKKLMEMMRKIAGVWPNGRTEMNFHSPKRAMWSHQSYLLALTLLAEFSTSKTFLYNDLLYNLFNYLLNYHFMMLLHLYVYKLWYTHRQLDAPTTFHFYYTFG